MELIKWSCLTRDIAKTQNIEHTRKLPHIQINLAQIYQNLRSNIKKIYFSYQKNVILDTLEIHQRQKSYKM